jgi:RHS repeat-associated protein
MHTRGSIIEENHYYAYGLKIAGISSKKMGDIAEGSLKNNYQYQGDYSEFDEDINWNDFELRNYDPQIGCFVQQDPYDQYPSPYTGMGNDPINNIDEDGGFSAPGAVIGGLAGFIAGGIYALANDKQSRAIFTGRTIKSVRVLVRFYNWRHSEPAVPVPQSIMACS